MKQQENYTGVCWYCGRIFLSRKSTAKYCCSKHNSLHSRYGPQLRPMASNNGEFVNHDFSLERTYHFLELEGNGKNSFWSIPFTGEMLRNFGYFGQLPVYDELILADSYVLKKIKSETFSVVVFYVTKPFRMLTKRERRNCILIRNIS